jgi:peptidoglycan/xylan/chitin deacetylase (PgdA/CDA1 family)
MPLRRSMALTAPPGGQARLDRGSPTAFDGFDVPATLPVVLGCPRLVERARLGWRWITPDQLERALDGLLGAGLRFVDLGAFLRRIAGPSEESAREVLLSFDASDVAVLDLAWPRLEARGIHPLVFVRTAYVGRRRAAVLPRSRSLQLNWSELRFLAEQGAAIGAQGHYGIDPRSVALEVAYGDLLRSRRELENRLGTDPIALSYATGRGDAEERHLAARAGFRLAFGRRLRPPFFSTLGLGTLDLGPWRRPRGTPHRVAGFWRAHAARPRGDTAPTDSG